MNQVGLYDVKNSNIHRHTSMQATIYHEAELNSESMCNFYDNLKD